MMEEEIGKIMFALDLGFSTFYKDESVLKLTLKEKLDIMKKAVELLKIEEAINFSILSSKGRDYPTAEIFSIDFPSSLRASIYLLLGGYYRQAILCLRDWLEIRLTGIYFSLVNKDQAKYEAWKRGEEKAPIGSGLIKRIFSHAEFHKVNKKLELRGRLEKLYAELSAFVHAGNLTRYDLQSLTDNVPRFNPQSVDIWFRLASRVFEELVLCSYQAYGLNAFSMNKDELEMLRKHLSKPYEEYLLENGFWQQQ
jgi:hypothetical protein